MVKTVKKKAGPKGPTKFTPTRRKRYLGLLAKGVRRGEAAKRCGVHRNTVIKAMADPEFAEAVDYAEMLMDDAVENALFLAATKDRNPTSIMFYLQNRRPKDWQDRRNVSLSGSVGIGVTDDKIDAELQRLLENRGANATEKPKRKRAAASNGHSGNGKK